MKDVAYRKRGRRRWLASGVLSVAVVAAAQSGPAAMGAGAVEPRDVIAGDSTRLVSHLPSGLAAGRSEWPSLSGSGGRVAFMAHETGLDGDPGPWRRQVYLWRAHRDTLSMISRGAAAGEPANCYSQDPSISADGRFVAFVSCATNLVAGAAAAEPQPNQPDVYLYDTVNQRTTLVSRSRFNPALGRNGRSMEPVVSPHGRFVAYTSRASNLVTGPNNHVFDVFLYDRSTKKTSLISASPTGEPGNDSSQQPDISRGGRSIAWVSYATNIVSDGPDTWHGDLFVTNRMTGETRLISRAPSGGPVTGQNFWPAISTNGRRVAWTSEADD